MAQSRSAAVSLVHAGVDHCVDGLVDVADAEVDAALVDLE